MICRNCGTENLDTNTVCTNCGNGLVDAPNPAMPNNNINASLNNQNIINNPNQMASNTNVNATNNMGANQVNNPSSFQTSPSYTQPTNNMNNKKDNNKKMILAIVLGVVLLVAVGVGGFFIGNSLNSDDNSNNSNNNNQTNNNTPTDNNSDNDNNTPTTPVASDISVSLDGIYLELPSDYIYEVGYNQIAFANAEQTWIASVTTIPVSYAQFQAQQSTVLSSLLSTMPITDYTMNEETRDGVDGIFIEGRSGEMYVTCFVIGFNSNTSFLVIVGSEEAFDIGVSETIEVLQTASTSRGIEIEPSFELPNLSEITSGFNG